MCPPRKAEVGSLLRTVTTTTTQNVPRQILLMAAVATLYALGGGLGLLLAIPPGYAAPVWPAAGIAVAALLLGGRGLWPGVLIGSLLVNLWIGREAVASGTVNAIVAAALIAAGAATQAIAGATLVRHFAPRCMRLDSMRSIVQFLVATGPASCLINATLGPTTLFALGIITRNEWAFNWWSWWIGDTIGAVVVAPLAIIWFGSAGRAWHSRRLHITLPMAIAVTVVIAAFVGASKSDLRRIEAALYANADATQTAVHNSFVSTQDAVSSLQSLYDSSTFVSREEFRAFSRRLLHSHHELLAVSWNPYISDAQRGHFEQLELAEPGRRMRIVERDSTGAIVPAATAPAYVPVSYIEPYGSNAAAVGFNVMSEAARREAIERAIASQGAAATARIQLVQTRTDDAGLLIFAPVFHKRDGVTAGDLHGFVVAVVTVPGLILPALDGLPLQRLHIELTDTTEADAPMSLGRWPVDDSDQKILLSVQRAFAFAGRRYELSLHAASDYFAANRSSGIGYILAGGLLMCAMLGAFLMVLTGHVHRERIRAAKLQSNNRKLADSIARRRQTELALEQEKAHAKATLDAIADGVISTDAAGRLDYMNPVAESLTGWPLEAARGRELADVFQVRLEHNDQVHGDPALLCLQYRNDVTRLGEMWLRSRDGNEYAIRQSTRAIDSAQQASKALVIAFQDVTQARQMVREIAHRAKHDQLTGLVNRAEFDVRLSRVMAAAQTRGAQHALCFIDLDHFKKVNDTAGHAAGDRMLQLVCESIRKHVRERDTLARFGGDEFVLLLEHCPLQRAEDIAAAIVRDIAACELVHDTMPLSVGASAGVTSITSSCVDAVDVVRRADQACYAAKRNGRNQVVSVAAPAAATRIAS